MITLLHHRELKLVAFIFQASLGNRANVIRVGCTVVVGIAVVVAIRKVSRRYYRTQPIVATALIQARPIV